MNAVASVAWRLYEAGDYAPALARFDKLLGAPARTNPAIQTGRGWSLLALGRAKRAAAAFAAALKTDANFASARRGLKAAKNGYRTAYLLAWDLAEAKLGAQRDGADAELPQTAELDVGIGKPG